MLGREREQRVLDAVVGQDHQRTLGAQPLREDPGRRRADLLQGVLVGDRRPRRIGACAIGEKDPLRRLPRPMLQPVADAARTPAAAVWSTSPRCCRRRGGRRQSQASRTSVSDGLRLAVAEFIGFLRRPLWGRRLALRENGSARQCAAKRREALAYCEQTAQSLSKCTMADWAELPAPLPNNRTNYLKSCVNSRNSICAYYVHNGTSLASIQMVFLAEPRRSGEPQPTQGRGIN